MKRLIVLIVALLAAWVGTTAIATAAVVPTNSEVVHGYAYDSHQHAACPSETVSGRGPPAAAYDYAAPPSANDPSLRGASAHSQPTSILAGTAYDPAGQVVEVVSGIGTTRTASGARAGDVRPALGPRVAANGVDIGGAKFAQNSFTETFGKRGLFSGRSIDDVAGALRSGAMAPKDVPIDVIVRDGNTDCQHSFVAGAHPSRNPAVVVERD